MPKNKFPEQKAKGAPINLGQPDKSDLKGDVPYSYTKHPSTGKGRPNRTEPVVGKLPKG